MTPHEFKDCMKLLVASVGKPISEEQSGAWFLLLGDLTVQQLQRGIVETIRTFQFAGFPPVGVIRKNAIGSVQSATLESNDRAVLAWDCVVDAIRTHGGYATVKFDDPLIPATIRAITSSWADLCGESSDQLHTWTKKAFIETYRAKLAAGHVTESSAAALPGILAEDASLHGFDIPNAIAIETNLPATPVKVLESKPVPLLPSNVARPVLRSIPAMAEKVPEPEVDMEELDRRREEFEEKRREQIHRLMDRVTRTATEISN